eukprot:2393076-Lingulodinium_polyedra.AAC.1
MLCPSSSRAAPPSKPTRGPESSPPAQRGGQANPAAKGLNPMHPTQQRPGNSAQTWQMGSEAAPPTKTQQCVT